MFTHTKQLKRIALGSSTLALALTAGTAMALAAQPASDRYQDRDQPRTQSQTERETQREREYNFQDRPDQQIIHLADSRELIGSELMNNLGEEIGNLDDFIVDRGSGKIIFAVVGSGDVLGMGGEQYVIPYNDLRYMAASQSFTANMTEEQVQRQSEFLPDNWNLQETGWMDNIQGWFTDDDEREREDWNNRIHESAASPDREQKTVEGQITKISRETYGGDEHTVLTIRDENNRDMQVVLAPSWHVSGMEHSINEQTEANIEAVKYGNRWVAMSGEIGGEDIKLRDKDGKANWETKRTNGNRYFLLSEINGQDVELAGSTFGEVQNAVIEAPSGHVALVGIDPNDNILGIGDEISLVPWAAVNITRDLNVRLNANEEEFNRTMTMPEDLSTLTSPTSLAQAYNAFGEEMPKFSARDERRNGMTGDRPTGNDRQTRDNRQTRDDRQTRDTRDSDRDRQDDKAKKMNRQGEAWGHDSDMVQAFAKGPEVEIEGTYRGTRALNLQENAPAAHVIVIDTDEGRRNVILGPDWFVQRENIDLRNGDEIKLKGRTATYAGSEYIAAWNLERDDDSWKFWSDKRPAWTE